MEKTYVIFQLPAYAAADKKISLGMKLYFRDNGFASVLANPGEGALFENAVFNQLRGYGELAYLSKPNEFKIDFVLSPPGSAPIGLETKYHPVVSDDQRLKRIAQSEGIFPAWIVGRYPTAGFQNFIWGGSIF